MPFLYIIVHLAFISKIIFCIVLKQDDLCIFKTFRYMLIL